VKDDSSDHITHAFPVVSCQDFIVVTPSFTHLSITFSNQRFRSYSRTVGVGFVELTSDSFCGNRGLKMNIQFCSPVTCAAVVVLFFEAILLDVRRSLSVSVDFRPCSSSQMLSSHDSCMPT
jgi:hypothetical protein